MSISPVSRPSETTESRRHRGALAIAATVVVAASLGSTAPAFAKGGGNDKDVRSSKACGTSLLKPKAKPDTGGIEVEAEYETHVSGKAYSVLLTDNGREVWKGSRTTQGPSGSFEVELLNTLADGSADDKPGDDKGGQTGGTDDPAHHDTGDDKGGQTGGTDDPAGHDTGDDKGGQTGGTDDPAGHDTGDDKGGQTGGTDDPAGH